jgi:UDP-glucose:(glucosyl)LPS alpha-1,2-glucosyltransferase
MSCVYKGEIVESEISGNANGGSEQMRRRLLDNVRTDLLDNFAIHFSRPRKIYDDVPNILYCHDLAEDPENKILFNRGWEEFDHFVFVSAWQRDQYVNMYGIPYSDCSVIYNAVEKQYNPVDKPTDTIRFIYHTTPHRGLELLVPIFDQLCKVHDNIHLDVFSSFEIYGWPERDEMYKQVFDQIEAHPKMTYHGTRPNEEVLYYLDKAHIFLYPNIWKETSCIALIEAIKSQVICVHPNYGALPETASNATIMYDYNEDLGKHANFCYSVAMQLINTIKQDPNYFNRFSKSDRFALARNNIESFTTMWNSLLVNLLDKFDNQDDEDEG